MNRNPLLLKLIAPAACAAFVLAAPAQAQLTLPGSETAPAQGQDNAGLPSAQEVVARYIEAAGGEEAIRAVQKVRSTGTLSVPMSGISGDMVILVDDSGDTPVSKATISLPGLGQIMQGTTASGKAYEVNPMQGTRVLTEDETLSMLEQTDFHSDLDLDKYYTDYKTVGRETVDGMQTIVVEMTGMNGKKKTVYFAEGGELDGLRVMSKAIESSPMGDIPSTTKFSDYRSIEGPAGPVKMSFKSDGDAGGNQIIVTIKEIDLDANINPDELAPPADVQSMLGETSRPEAGMLEEGAMDDLDELEELDD